MPNESLSFIQRLQEYGLLGYAWLLFISFWAGTVRYLTTLNGEKPKLWEWLAKTVVSGFVGVTAAMLCQYYSLDYLLTAVITSISAHNGTQSLHIISQIIKKNSGQIASLMDVPQKRSSFARKDKK